MPRFNSFMTLYNVGVETDDRGVVSEVVTDEVDVYANTYNVGAASWAAARSVGLHADAQVAIRAFDYGGQQRAVMDGVEYEIERVSGGGEFATLTLKRRLRNARD